MTSERRAEPRHLTCYPIQFQREEGHDDIALIHDLSVSGALLFTRVALDVGSPVALMLDVFGDPTRVERAAGHVVRIERRAPEVSDLWIWSVGVELDEPMPALEPAIRELEKKIRSAR